MMKRNKKLTHEYHRDECAECVCACERVFPRVYMLLCINHALLMVSDWRYGSVRSRNNRVWWLE